jgi:hypothetical protein
MVIVVVFVAVVNVAVVPVAEVTAAVGAVSLSRLALLLSRRAVIPSYISQRHQVVGWVLYRLST